MLARLTRIQALYGFYARKYPTCKFFLLAKSVAAYSTNSSIKELLALYSIKSTLSMYCFGQLFAELAPASSTFKKSNCAKL